MVSFQRLRGKGFPALEFKGDLLTGSMQAPLTVVLGGAGRKFSAVGVSSFRILR